MKTRTWLMLPAALAVIGFAAVTAGCGSDDEQSASTATTSPQLAGNAADAGFVVDMTAHHDGAIEMARIAQRRAEHPEIKQLADDIVAAQEREIAAMTRIQPQLPEHDGHTGMSDADMGMDGDPATLAEAEPFDRAFIDMMVPHHEGAITMAKDLLEHGEAPELRRMADDIIDAQTREIARMRAWRNAWYGAASGSGHDIGEMDH